MLNNHFCKLERRDTRNHFTKSGPNNSIIVCNNIAWLFRKKGHKELYMYYCLLFGPDFVKCKVKQPGDIIGSINNNTCKVKLIAN